MLSRLRQLWDWIIDRRHIAAAERPARARITRFVAARPAAAPTPVVSSGRPGGHTSESEWGCVARVLQAAVDTADRARELQEQAALQIDSATYAFGSLLEELSAVMPVAGLEGSRGKRATVHALSPARMAPRRAGALAA